ncbi:MAG: esterase FrsA [Rhodospirillales bacterium]|nr:esterase FrsA [Rhodospirillales bacterium]
MARDRLIEIAIANWGGRFISNGVPFADFQEVTAGLERWEDWCRAWSDRAALHEKYGREALETGHGISAGEHLQRAAVLYHFGKYLFVEDMEQYRAAHMKSVDCHTLALPHLDPPGERVEIPYEGKMLYGVLRKPPGVVRPPVMIMCVGLDSTKEEMATNEAGYLRRGIATLSFDGPGQGEGEIDFAIRPDYEAAVSAVADFIETRKDIDPGRIGLWGVSLGGYYAPRAAAFEKRVRACVAISGPFCFADAWPDFPPMSKKVFQQRARCETMGEADEAAARLTLEGVAGNITCPLFIVTGDDDPVIPPHSTQRIADEAGGEVKFLLVERGGHNANKRRYCYDAQTADWMAAHLGAV